MKNDIVRLAGKPADIKRGISAFASQGAMTPAIALYGVIGIDFRARDLAVALSQYAKAPELDIYVHSAGGSVVEGLALYNIFQRFEGFKRFHIDGIAASMMSVVICAGDEVVMPDNTQVMIHLPRLGPNEGGMVADDLRGLADHLDEYGEKMLDAYVRRTGQPREVLLKLTRDETYLSAIEALELGFADTVTTPLEMVAQINLDQPQEQIPMETVTSPAAPATAIVKEAIVATTKQDAPNVVSAPVPTEADVRASVQAAEQTRRAAVTASFGGFATGHADLLNACLLDMTVTPEQAKDKLLAKLGEGTSPTATSAHVHVDNGNLVGDSVRNSIEARLGLEAADSSNHFIGMSLMELARASLSHRSIGIAGMDRNGIVGLAFTHSSSDFGNLLADIARKSMLKGLEETEESFQKWTAKGTLSDFREASRVDLSTFPSLRKVPEGAEYKYVTVGDRGEKIVLATYGELFSITRQAVINDDLSAMTRVPQLMGRAAIRTVGDLVYAVLGNNPQMSDGKALFHNDHKNKLTAAALSVARIDEAKTKMRTQKDGSAVLNIRPAYLLTPVALESTAKALLAAEYDPAMVDAKVPNPVRGIVEVISDARLDEQSLTTSYMAASQSMYDTIEVAYLDGNDKPYLEQQQGFTVDGAAFKVRIDAGVAPLSWRTMVQLPGN
ncbi:ClpP-like prohead protease/major capsid protein fusion protein [Pseudomonas sp.]|uniref:ClpP-like prohead protease/major capsid protein fusion protein n=1 Tax=Pseudomonas sp. TaxID=306 RepID=UPI00257C3646|nr:ClpP-like prohead protease/major capsid protein fusion protein [Pseudomonas sp.]